MPPGAIGPAGSAAGPVPPPGWGAAPGAGWPAGQPTRPERSGMAIAAMICGLVGLLLCFLVVPSVVAVVLGFVAASRIKRSGGRVTGLGAARTGWITGIIGLAAGAALFTTAALGAFDDEGEVAVFDLDEGDCVDVPLDDTSPEVDTLERIDCDSLHNGEVFLTGELNPDGDEPYPADPELFDELDAICREALVDIHDEPFSSLPLPIGPDERAWRIADGPYLCIAVAPGGTTGRLVD
jgi:Domain of unknown function (DUF4190)